jgi:hypothetical protein
LLKIKKMNPGRKTTFDIIALTVTFLLFLFCIGTIMNRDNRKEGSMDLFMAEPGFYEKSNGCSLDVILSFRHFSTYSLTNTEASNRLLFAQIQSSIRNIVVANNSQKGIHVKLNTKTRYEDFIRIIEICGIEKAGCYIVDNYDVWIMTGKNKALIERCPYRYMPDE